MSHATSEMTFNLDQLFTHKDILQSRETNLFQQEKGEELTISEQMRIIESEGGAAYSHCPHALPLIKKGDFISILNCAWKKNYAEDISFKNVHDPKNGVGDLLLNPKYIQSKIGELEEQIIAGPWNCSGRGRTKKLAQHRAAANVLLKIIEDGRHKEFLIPGQNEEEAREIIMNAMEEQKIINSAAPQVQGTQSISSSESSSTVTAAPPSGQQTNWIGKLNELIQIKKIRCHWSDHVDQRNGPLNVVEHCHKTILVIEDSEKKFEGNGNGKNKKLAKQLAHKEIYEQLCQIYELNNQMESTTMKQSTSSTMAAENNLVKNDEQIEQNDEKSHQNIPIKTNQPSIPPSIECIQTTNIVEEAKIQIENIDENVENGQSTDIRPYLEEIFTNRNKLNPEIILRQIFAWKDARIVKAFPQAELKFVETKRNPLFDVQIYLEIWAGHGSKRILNCTFGGEGIDIKAAKNDAIWQAIEFIYYFVDIPSHLNE